jgi:hypothetical protein
MANYLLDTNHASPLVTIGHPLRNKILGSVDITRNLYSVASKACPEKISRSFFTRNDIFG